MEIFLLILFLLTGKLFGVSEGKLVEIPHTAIQTEPAKSLEEFMIPLPFIGEK